MSAKVPASKGAQSHCLCVNLNNVRFSTTQEELAAMTRWSLRRLLGGTKDAEDEYRPVSAAPVAGRPLTDRLATDRPPAGQPSADQAPAAQARSSLQAAGWFEPGWGRPAPQGPAQPGTGPYGPGESGGGPYGQGQPGNAPPGADRHGVGQYSPSHYGADQYNPQYGGSLLSGKTRNGAAILAPAQPPAALRPPAPLQTSPLQPGRLQSSTVQPAEPVSAPARDAAAWLDRTGPAEHRPGGAWPDICDQFGLHLLVLAEQLRTSLDELEADEDDPERLRRLYQVDHAVTRMRRASRDLRTLAGRSEEELAGFTTSLLDVIRMALSAIERYTQVTIGRVTDLAVLGYAADDVGSVMAALLDNATRYSPGTVTVSGHLLEDGSVMFRVEDTGIGMGTDQVNALNSAFAGPVPEVDERTGRHTGFPVVHRIARKHSIGVRLASRPLPSTGTVAMVTLPPHLLCEVPAQAAQRRPVSPTGSPATGSPGQSAPRPSAVTDLPRGEPTRPHQTQQWEPPQLPERDQARSIGELPRRERASLRGDELRPAPHEPAKTATPEQQAAARRAFADDLSAFSLGTVSPGPGGAPDSAVDNATEEEAPP
jgi:hypothetical protein